MTFSLGKKIFELRKEKGMTQEELSQKLGVSPQAVSKWENDLSYPDIMLLPEIAKLFGVTVDELFSETPKKEVGYLPENQRKSFDELVLKIIVDSARGDNVRMNIPLPLIKIAIEMGMKMPGVSGNDVLKDIDIDQVLALAEKGFIGKLLEVESAEGDTVEIVVE